MAILKSIVKNQFSIIPNEVIRDKTLSHSEYRLLIYLYSLPDNWKINQGYLASELSTTRNKINQRLAIIKKQGYLDIEKNSKSNKEEVDYLYILKVPDTPKLDTPKLDTPKLGAPKTGTYINNNINNTNNINNELNKKESNTNVLLKKSYFENEELNKTFIEFLEIRKKLKAINSDIAITKLINFLNNKATNDKERMLIIEKSIMNSWKGLFELKKEEKPKEEYKQEKVYLN